MARWGAGRAGGKIVGRPVERSCYLWPRSTGYRSGAWFGASRSLVEGGAERPTLQQRDFLNLNLVVRHLTLPPLMASPRGQLGWNRLVRPPRAGGKSYRVWSLEQGRPTRRLLAWFQGLFLQSKTILGCIIYNDLYPGIESSLTDAAVGAIIGRNIRDNLSGSKCNYQINYKRK